MKSFTFTTTEMLTDLNFKRVFLSETKCYTDELINGRQKHGSSQGKTLGNIHTDVILGCKD